MPRSSGIQYSLLFSRIQVLRVTYLLSGENVSHQIRIPRPVPHWSWNVGIGFGPNVAHEQDIQALT